MVQNPFFPLQVWLTGQRGIVPIRSLPGRVGLLRHNRFLSQSNSGKSRSENQYHQNSYTFEHFRPPIALSSGG
jgi:hypothetical protein